MTSATYQFGLLTVVFGGFLSLNGAQFGGLESVVNIGGLLAMLLGLFVGVLGLVPSEK